MEKQPASAEQSVALSEKFKSRISVTVLALFAAVFAAAFILKAIKIYDVFGTSAYDLGLHAQSFWLLSQMGDAFNTVRGMHTFGDHIVPIEFVFVPLYWMWPSVYWAFILQTASVVLGAVAIYLISLHFLPNRPLVAMAMAIAWLVNPAVHNTLLWQYHGMVLASGLIPLLVLAYLKDQRKVFFVLLVAVLACREEMAVTTFMLGLIALVHRRWNYALPTMVLSVAWMLTSLYVVLPFYNGEGYFQHTSGNLSVIRARLFEWQFYYERFVESEEGRHYVFMVLYPLAALGVLRPLWLMPAVPTVITGVLIGGYKADINYHYSVSAMPFIFISAIAAIATFQRWCSRFDRRGWTAAALVALIVSLNVHAYATASVLGMRFFADDYRQWEDLAARRAQMNEVVSEIGEAGVSATDFLLPHLAHRRHVYLLPNPWRSHYWGLHDENPHHPNNVRYLAVDPWMYVDNVWLLTYLTDSGLFSEQLRGEGLLLLRRERDELPDREAAVKAMDDFIEAYPFRFKDVWISKPYPSTDPPFLPAQIDVDSVAPSEEEGWKPLEQSNPGVIQLLTPDSLKEPEHRTSYIVAEAIVDEAAPATLWLGADTAIAVWVNGQLVLQKTEYKSASLGEDRIPIELRAGTNRLVIRVNHDGHIKRTVAQLRLPLLQHN